METAVLYWFSVPASDRNYHTGKSSPYNFPFDGVLITAFTPLEYLVISYQTPTAASHTLPFNQVQH